MASQQQTGRAASRARRELQVNGKGRSAAASAPTRQPNRRERKPVPAANPTPAPAPQAAAPVVPSFAAPAPRSMPRPKPAQKSPSRLRRESLAARGKKAETSRDRQRDSEMALKRRSAAEAKSAKGDCGCGGPCCQEAEAKAAASTAAPMLSTQASTGSKFVAKKKPVVNASNSGRMLSRARRTAMSGRGKAGLEAHGKGNSSASLARQANPDISARDLARVVRDSRSKSGARGSAAAAPTRTRRPRNAAEAKRISGTEVGHTEKLTGDEAGLCHGGVTGTDYMASEVFEKFCKTEPPKAPKKVEQTETLKGTKVTSGGKVGGSTVLTGADAGNCRDVTGSEYLGREHFAQQCAATPAAAPAKVSTSKTSRGLVISGPRTDRAENVTGNRKGTCKSISGTPYTGSEQFESFCAPEEQRAARKASVMPRTAAREISGIQPGLDEGVTGAETGACQAVSGTPYIAESDLKSLCGAVPAKPGDADFPQALNNSTEVAGEFSVLPTVADAPVVLATAAAPVARSSSVTGAGNENEGPITGAFSMGQGKVTGTEQARFGNRSSNVATVESKPVSEAPTASRITGEGIETGLRITGDDWDRGDRVTGTEGSTAAQRNPSRRGAMSAMPEVASKREPQVVRESANVTGGSGGSQGAAFITVSGGARG